MKAAGRRRLIVFLVLLALTVAVTALARIPCEFTTKEGKLAGTYATLGDVCIFASAILLGGPVGAVAALLGSALADAFVGSYSYIIGSILIKGGMALFIGKFAPLCDNWKKSFVIAGIAEAIMVLGYFLFDLIIFGQYAIAAQELPVNLAQGVVCGALGAVIIRFLPGAVRSRRVAPRVR